MTDTFDVIIIGAGHNGLVCAARLGAKGKRVLVLEAGDCVGGLAVTREFAPGYKVSGAAHLLYGLHPEVRNLCFRQGGKPVPATTGMTTLVSDASGKHAKIGPGTSLPGNREISKQDKQRWSAFNRQADRFAGLLTRLSGQCPPRLKNGGLNDARTLATAGWALRSLGKEDMRRFLQVIGMNIHDLAGESLGSNLLSAAVCFEAVLGSRLGPRAPNTVFNWLNRRSLAQPDAAGLRMPAGGMGAFCDALAENALERGVEVRTGSRVVKILIEQNRAQGVLLENGKKHLARRVASCADLKTTLLRLAGAENLDTEVVRRIRHVPTSGTTAKIHIALERLPRTITGSEDDFLSRIICAPDPDAIERASNAIKYNEYADYPVFEVTVPSAGDPSLAPDGAHVMSVLVPFVPYEHNQGWPSRKAQFENLMLDRIDQLLPGTRAAACHIETLLPADIERICKVTGGHWHHCEPGLERSWMLRPIPGYGQYQTSIDGLFLCGADGHPGGDVSGIAGFNAANALLGSLRHG